MKKILILIGLSFFIFPIHSKTVEEIMEEAASRTLIPSIQGRFLVSMESSNGDVRNIEALAYQEADQDGVMRRLFVFENPPTVRGTGLLIHSSYKEEDNNMWIYLPAVRRVKRIALESSGGGYFMGSDFTYRDLIGTEEEGYEQSIVDEVEMDGVEYYVVRSSGVTLEKQQAEGYSYTLNYYRKSDSFLVKKEYFDMTGEHLKTYLVEDEIRFGQFIYPNLVTMENVQTGHRSDITLVDINTEDIPDRYFTTRNLQSR